MCFRFISILADHTTSEHPELEEIVYLATHHTTVTVACCWRQCFLLHVPVVQRKLVNLVASTCMHSCTS